MLDTESVPPERRGTLPDSSATAESRHDSIADISPGSSSESG